MKTGIALSENIYQRGSTLRSEAKKRSLVEALMRWGRLFLVNVQPIIYVAARRGHRSTYYHEILCYIYVPFRLSARFFFVFFLNGNFTTLSSNCINKCIYLCVGSSLQSIVALPTLVALVLSWLSQVLSCLSRDVYVINVKIRLSR